jgi:hypothetical protein
MRGLDAGAPTDTVKLCSDKTAKAKRPPSGKQSGKASRLKMRLVVKRHPRKAGRLLISARCSTGCRLRVQLRVPRARAARKVSSSTVTTRRSARNQTLSVNYAKRVRLGAKRLKVKVTAVSWNGQRVTRYRTVRLRRSA